RRLPPLVVRLLIAVDLFLGLLPPWTWFLLCRWKGRLVGPREFFHFVTSGPRFAWQHIRHTSQGTGAFNVGWRSAPVRSAQARERDDHAPRGSCGTCKN